MRNLFVIIVMITACSSPAEHSVLVDELRGKWIADAWGGQLHESWKLQPDGWLLQEAYYIEGGDTSYHAFSRILKTGGQWVLYSIIDDSNPKIFQAAEKVGDSIVFVNTEYRNPSTVVYEFVDENNYRRTIRGVEAGQPSETVFKFQKVKD